MNSGATAERIYDALKAQLLSGEIMPGEKLEPAAFAEELGSSVTPVRDVLHRLTGERLVETRTSEGFYLPLVTEPGLRDLYAWSAQLTRLAVNAWPRAAAPQLSDDFPDDGERTTRELFERIAARSDNAEHTGQIDSTNDRLAAPRAAEARVLGDPAAEIGAMAAAIDSGEPAALLKLLAAYHRRRTQAAPGIVRALYRH